MDKGTLIEFRLHGACRLAVVEGPHGKQHWLAQDERGQTHTLHPRQVTHTVVGKRYRPEDISAFVASAQPYLAPEQLEAAWECLVAEGQGTNLTALAELLFGELTPATVYAAHRLLFEDTLFFKQKGESFEPRSIEQVAELRHQRAVAEQKQRAFAEFLARVEQALGGAQVPWTEAEQRRWEAVERLALETEGADVAAAHELLGALNRPKDAAAARGLLQAVRWWSSHENLFLRRSSLRPDWTEPGLRAAALRASDPPSDPLPRLDLTAFPVMTIDDASTREIDDGINLEPLADGRERIWIHIADPSRWLQPGDALDLEAREHATTLYLPERVAPMFPLVLAAGPMSLRAGACCNALSFGVLLEADGRVAQMQIQASQIRPVQRLTYEEADVLLEQPAPHPLQRLAHWAQVRARYRVGRGAINLALPEISIKVRGDVPTLSVLQDTPSRQLVAEMMILVGDCVGQYGIQHQLPLPYRQQPQPNLPSESELQALPDPWLRSLAMRRCMPPSTFEVQAAPHASLALSAYVQATSPIRRYTDLLAHYQLKAHLAGIALPFDAATLEGIVQQAGARMREATLVERQTKRYWLLEHLRLGGERAWEAVWVRWLRQDEDLCLILLPELATEFVMRRRTGCPGERFWVRVTQVDPRQDEIRFKETTPSLPPETVEPVPSNLEDPS